MMSEVSPKPAEFNPIDIRSEASLLGPEWQAVYKHSVDFGAPDFETAMANILLEPNINSTSILRADIVRDDLVDFAKIKSWMEKRGISNITEEDLRIVPKSDNSKSALSEYQLLRLVKTESPAVDLNTMPLTYYLDDIEPRSVQTELVSLERSVVRRIIPRNPLRDHVINQTCAIHTLRIDKQEQDSQSKRPPQDSIFVAYIPHIESPDECPFYLPPARAVGVLYHNYSISVHYLLYDQDKAQFSERDPVDRIIRIALHLLETPYKHSFGAKTGYKKRVHHDIVIPKVVFQDRYIDLKAKYSKILVSGWVETTDPKKHVFEDLAIAAFIIELWNQTYKNKDEFVFVDIGCGNGLLVNILIKEGYKGYGIDARERKSWSTFTDDVKSNLKEQVIVPKVLVDQTTKSLFNNPHVNVCDFPENAFIIGNHSDELTVWAPLFDRPFIVIPCCSYSLSGSKVRYQPKDPKSTYASLVDHVIEVASEFGWVVEKEILRIPSTRNTALIGRTRVSQPKKTLAEILESEGGADGWVERTMSLNSKKPRNH